MSEWFKKSNFSNKYFFVKKFKLNHLIIILLLLLYNLSYSIYILFIYLFLNFYGGLIPHRNLKIKFVYLKIKNNYLFFIFKYKKQIIGGLILTPLLFVFYILDYTNILNNIAFHFLKLKIILSILPILILVKLQKNEILFKNPKKVNFFFNFLKRILIICITNEHIKSNINKINYFLFFINKKSNKIKFVFLNKILLHFLFQKIFYSFFSYKNLIFNNNKVFFIKFILIQFFFNYTRMDKKRISFKKYKRRLVFLIKLFCIHINFFLIFFVATFLKKLFFITFVL